jgi:hypothetical protein
MRDAFAVGHDLPRKRGADLRESAAKGVACAESLAPLAPDASSRTVSLVDVSPSTEMRLKLSSMD